MGHEGADGSADRHRGESILLGSPPSVNSVRLIQVPFALHLDAKPANAAVQMSGSKLQIGS
jgi:hypothetical protein